MSTANQFQFEHVVISGGATKGIAAVSFLNYLEEFDKCDIDLWSNRRTLKSITGVSIGSLIAVCLALKIRPSKMLYILRNKFSISDMFSENYEMKVNTANILSGIQSLGLDDGIKMEQFVETLIETETSFSGLTLMQLHRFSKLDVHKHFS